MKISKAQGFVDLFNQAVIEGDEVKTYIKYVKDLSNTFKDSKQAIKQGEQEAYHVSSIMLENETKEALRFGITYLQPVLVSEEFTLTRGHFHQNLDYGEVYIGLTGHAYLIKWDGKDEVIVEDVVPGSVHLINGNYAHRLVNVADVESAVGAVWAPLSGQNYEPIEKTGFPVRVFNRNGNIVVEEQV